MLFACASVDGCMDDALTSDTASKGFSGFPSLVHPMCWDMNRMACLRLRCVKATNELVGQVGGFSSLVGRLDRPWRDTTAV